MALITIATFTTSIEAHVAKTKLESEGIECFVADEHTIGVQPFYSNAIGGVKLQVKQEDLKRAQDALKIPNDELKPQCPKCGGTDVKPVHWGRRASFLSVILMNLPLPFSKNRYRCVPCNHAWR